jgi:hypothetical protein
MNLRGRAAADFISDGAVIVSDRSRDRAMTEQGKGHAERRLESRGNRSARYNSTTMTNARRVRRKVAGERCIAEFRR